jgi:hypothetical protein
MWKICGCEWETLNEIRPKSVRLGKAPRMISGALPVSAPIG